jgi:cytidyltransferase-like protein
MIKVFVSGCYDIVHAGHVQFFREAKALGDHLTVCFASDDVLWKHKNRRSSLPEEHKGALIAAIDAVDEVVMGEDDELGLDFASHFRRLKPNILAVTEDDHYEDIKKKLCDEIGAEYLRLPKTPPQFPPVSTSGIVKWIKAPDEAPLRVDFAGGWLDVPRFARPGGRIVNCAIAPLVSLQDWPYHKRAGMGGSGAWALLNGESGVQSEIGLGVGWQDPAIIRETGLCVWQSGEHPHLLLKRDGALLKGCLAIYYTGEPHDTPGLANHPRDYDRIEKSGQLAAEGVEQNNLEQLAAGVREYYAMQLDEGMKALPEVNGTLACKYCGGGFGGYGLYLFPTESDRAAALASQKELQPIEPYLRDVI